MRIGLKFTFFLNRSSKVFDQYLRDVTAVDVTAISTPLDRVPLYTIPSENVPIILLKSSQASKSSDLLSFGTPEMKTQIFLLKYENGTETYLVANRQTKELYPTEDKIWPFANIKISN